MDSEGVDATLTALLASLACVFLVEAVARRRGMLDRPNWRSSHSIPTPRLGGVGIVVGVWAGVAVAWHDPTPNMIALLVGATALAIVGLADDIRPLGAALRLVAQVGVSVIFVVIAAPSITIVLPGWSLVLPAGVGEGLAVIWIVGVVNVWNFMDGLDGLAAGTAAIAAIGLVAIGAPTMLMLSVAGSCLGFLVWNHSRASIFMGDSGSMFLGFLIGGAALAGPSPIPIISVALLIAPFLLDASYTFTVRLLRRQPVLSAHHEHLYQRLADARVEHRAIAGLYWVATGMCALVAIRYVSSANMPKLGMLAVIATAFTAYVLVVRQLEGGVAKA